MPRDPFLAMEREAKERRKLLPAPRAHPSLKTFVRWAQQGNEHSMNKIAKLDLREAYPPVPHMQDMQYIHNNQLEAAT